MPYFTLWSREEQAVKYVARRVFFSAVAVTVVIADSLESVDS